MKKAITFSLLFFVGVLSAQQVETVTSHPKIVDGLYVDASGIVYTTAGGLVGGNEIGKYDPYTNIFDPFFATGFSGTINIGKYQDSLFAVTNFDNNTVSRYNLNTGVVDILATSLDGPAGIAIDTNDNIFVTNFGAPPTYSGHVITKITPAGVASVYIDSSALFRLQAICFNHENVLIVHSQEALYKINAADSTLVHWVDLGHTIGNMTFRHKDSCIYATAGGATDRLIRIDSDGVISVFSGVSAGYEDGDISEALFSNPLGIAFTPSEDTLYVSEAAGANRLRRILFSQVAGLFVPLTSSISIYPNPASETIHIQSESEKLTVQIRNSAGKIVLVKNVSTKQSSINIEHLSPGIYFIELSSSSEQFVQKIVKQ